ncbi:MAG TPA: formate--tetrahydrofolate ligase [Candidatus Coproplasma stercoravium]|nr:formate--tetrahydrofolate ligase [Candidatus Coproplasma stercoravium]
MLSDIEIAESCVMQPITRIAAKLGLSEDELELYGRYKAKINLKEVNPKSKLILVTSINPTASGEGKTTVSIGLADGLTKLGKKACLALREPSLGPVFGIKGGAAGGGYAQVVPMADINLHFTGDLHAITSANNLLCAVIDNHIFRGNALKIKEVYFHRCMDMNDRALRDLTISCEAGKMKGCESYSRREHFDITAASEIMAILCLATDLSDLKRRLENIVVGEDENGNFVYARDLHVAGAMATLLKDAIKPNLVQTLEGTPAIVHGGPFANIAHGCNSVRATYTAMTLADYTVTEAGFGADLGAEKFLDTKCRVAGIQPDCIVVVATVKALKLHGGADKNNLSEENLEALKAGLPNLLKHVENMKKVYSKPTIVAMNRFASDTPAEIQAVISACDEAGAPAVFTDVFLKGGEGGRALAEKVAWSCDKPSQLTYAYNLGDDIKTKIHDIVTKVYGGDGAEYSPEAEAKIADIEGKGIKGLPVIIAKTQYSLSDDAKKLARPQGFKIRVRDIIYKGGANFIVAVAGDINLMPGLGKVPAAEHIDIDADGNISGLS